MKSNMKDLPFLILRGIDIAETLDPIRRVNINISPKRLAKRLDLFSSTPDTALAALRHFGIETLLGLPSRGRGRTSGG